MVPSSERPLPFPLRIAKRLTTETAPRYEDGAILFGRRASLTGEPLALTGEGRDLEFSDIEIDV